MAASNGDFDIVRFLLDSGLCAEGTDWTPVHVACSKGHGQLIPVMVHEEMDLEPTDEGTTALYMACVSRNEKAVRYLLRRGVTADVRDDGGWTPLHEACCSGEEEIMRMLLKKGASVDAVNQRGLTPFHVACEYDQIDILDLLLHVDGGAATDTRSVSGDTPLHSASFFGHLRVVQWLTDKGADLVAGNNTGNTPLHSACTRGHEEIAKLLLDGGANMEAKNHEGDTPVQMARMNGHTHLQTMLESMGAVINL
ncbi:hypothetical protein BaRGS_00036457 [Batillaria attramentaria]|uniref:Ankyrin repeat protein n=1 Tax=Batillaria attramentaria TaxID=370345 RepID=A0ABD0JCC8_9CAEN